MIVETDSILLRQFLNRAKDFNLRKFVIFLGFIPHEIIYVHALDVRQG